MRHKWYDLPALDGRRLYDAETDTELVVEQCTPAFPSQPVLNTECDGALRIDPDLDIPF